MRLSKTTQGAMEDTPEFGEQIEAITSVGRLESTSVTHGTRNTYLDRKDASRFVRKLVSMRGVELQDSHRD